MDNFANQYILVFIVMSAMHLNITLLLNFVVFAFKRKWFIWSSLITITILNLAVEFHAVILAIHLLSLVASELFLKGVEKNNL